MSKAHVGGLLDGVGMAIVTWVVGCACLAQSDVTRAASVDQAPVPTANAADSWRQLADAPTLFGARCAVCHASGFLIPSPTQLGRLTAAEIEDILWNGPMQEYANGLDTGQRHMLAEWVSTLNADKPPLDGGVPMCKDPQKWNLGTGSSASWRGTSYDNTFQRIAVGTSLTAAEAAHNRLAYTVALPIAVEDGAGNPVAVVGNRVFTANFNRWVYALDAASGCAVWKFHAQDRIRSNVAIEDGIVVFGDVRANAYGIDANTGRLLWFKHVDSAPTARITGNVTLMDGVVYAPLSSWEEMSSWQVGNPCCSFRGSVVALNAKTGEFLWRSMMIEETPRFIGRTSAGVNRYGPAGVPVWSGISVDHERHRLYIATGNQYTGSAVRYAGPQVKESDAIVALDPATGQKIWATPVAPEATGGSDFWEVGCMPAVDPVQASCSNPEKEDDSDMDISTPPVLVKSPSGKSLLLAGTKGGIFFALNPDDGHMEWKIRLGAGGHVGGIQYGLATNGRFAFVPISDVTPDPKIFDSWTTSGVGGTLNAVDLETGKVAWKYQSAKDACKGREKEGCVRAFLSPPTVVGDVVFAGGGDGVLRGFVADTGKEVWSFDAYREFSGVNGRKGRGGSFAYGGPAVAGGRLYIMSGAGFLTLGMGGNVLLAFDLGKHLN